MQFGFLAPIKNIILNPRETALFKSFDLMSRLLWLNLLTVTPLPAGRFATVITGAAVGDLGDFAELFTNKSDRPVAVSVRASFAGNPGQQVKISFSADRDTAEIIDYLSTSVAEPAYSIKSASTTILVLPGQRIYIATAKDANFPLTANDRFMAYVFDIADYLGESAWESR